MASVHPIPPLHALSGQYTCMCRISFQRSDCLSPKMIPYNIYKVQIQYHKWLGTCPIIRPLGADVTSQAGTSIV